MKKQHIFIGGGILLALVVIFLVGLSIQTQAKNDQEDTNSKELTEEDYVLEDTPDSSIETAAKEIDTDPNSVTVLVNKEYKLDSDYKPDDLVVPDIKYSFSYADEKRNMRKEAADAIALLFAGAEYEGYELAGVSGFRSFVRQTTLYNYNLLNKGYDFTSLYSARPGASEHQTGLAMDISSKSVYYKLTDEFGESEDGKWVKENCYKYGFIIRYPADKTDITGYGYEPWHIRYVGYDLAKYLYDNNLTLEEYYGYTPNAELIESEQTAYYNDLVGKTPGATIESSNDSASSSYKNSSTKTNDNDSTSKSSSTYKDDSDDDSVAATTASTSSSKNSSSTTKSTATPAKSYSTTQNSAGSTSSTDSDTSDTDSSTGTSTSTGTTDDSTGTSTSTDIGTSTSTDTGTSTSTSSGVTE